MNKRRLEKAAALLDLCRRRGIKLATTESCTGGLVIGCLTEVAGSSDVVDRGFVTYSNAAKIEMVGVPAGLISRFGAVSEPVARAMAEGALAHSNADIAVAVTGIAGPGGATPGKPVGLVHFGCARRGHETRLSCQVFEGDRRAIRESTVEAALDMVRAVVETS